MKHTIGEKAPNFTGIDQNGNQLNLADYKGKKVALFFYPKDNTPGCTAQACNLAENIDLLTAHNIAVIGVSIDSVESHKKFEQKYNLSFPLIADTNHELVQLYDVWGPKTFMGKSYIGTNRTTFLINESGTIDAIIDKVKTKDHAQQILDIWQLH